MNFNWTSSWSTKLVTWYGAVSSVRDFRSQIYVHQYSCLSSGKFGLCTLCDSFDLPSNFSRLFNFCWNFSHSSSSSLFSTDDTFFSSSDERSDGSFFSISLSLSSAPLSASESTAPAGSSLALLGVFSCVVVVVLLLSVECFCVTGCLTFGPVLCLFLAPAPPLCPFFAPGRAHAERFTGAAAAGGAVSPSTPSTVPSAGSSPSSLKFKKANYQLQRGRVKRQGSLLWELRTWFLAFQQHRNCQTVPSNCCVLRWP